MTRFGHLVAAAAIVAASCDRAVPQPPCAPPATVALSPTCAFEVCTGIVRFDYLTLAPKGYAFQSAAFAPVDTVGAKAAGTAFLAEHNDAACPGCASASSELAASAAGMYLVTQPAGDFGGFAMVSAASGQVVAGGGIVWGGRGAWWRPTTWQSPADLKCMTDAVDTAGGTAYLHESHCTAGDQTPAIYSVADAKAVALRLNVAAGFAARGRLDLFALLYTPTVGHCDPLLAEFVVVMTQHVQ